MKYNIVLIPDSNEIEHTLISLANEVSLKQGLEPNYLLRKQLSIPHVSVIQFEIEKNLLSPGIFGNDNQAFLELIWKHVSETWQQILSQSDKMSDLICTLPQIINYKHDTQGTFSGISWSEVIINKTENLLLQQFHDNLREKLEPLGIKCLNAFGERYNPHFTLFNIHTVLLEQANLIREIPESYFTTLKSFSVKPAFGVANNNWELIIKLKEEKYLKLNQNQKNERSAIYS